jgi:cyclase
MLKARVIGVVPVKDGWAVQSIGFKRFLPVGRPEVSVEFLDRYGVDEIALLDISATREGRGPDVDMLARCARRCHVPIAAGGGVTTLEQMHRLVRNGADKVIVNSAAIDNPHLLEEGASHFGAQAMLASIDVRSKPDGSHEVYTHCGTRARNMTPAEAARLVEKHGAGEILVTSIDRDGAKTGYDVKLLAAVQSEVRVPVILLGGVGHPKHLAEGLRAGAAAVAAGNFFNFAEHSVGLAKRYLVDQGVKLRLDQHAAYDGAAFDADGRLARKSEDYLDDLLFTRIVEEVI